MLFIKLNSIIRFLEEKINVPLKQDIKPTMQVRINNNLETSGRDYTNKFVFSIAHSVTSTLRVSAQIRIMGLDSGDITGGYSGTISVGETESDVFFTRTSSSILTAVITSGSVSPREDDNYFYDI